jgi:hypothetical protein
VAIGCKFSELRGLLAAVDEEGDTEHEDNNGNLGKKECILFM